MELVEGSNEIPVYNKVTAINVKWINGLLQITGFLAPVYKR